MTLKNLALRVLVAIFGIPLLLFTFYHGSYPLLVIVLIINIFSQYEFYKLGEKKNALPLKYFGIIIGIIVTLTFFYRGIEKLWIVLLSGIIIILLIELFRNKPNATLNVSATIAGILYPTTLFSFVILMRELPKSINVAYNLGGLWLILTIITIWICDTAAYFVGSAIGKHKLFKRVSPHKTVEGALAGFVFSLVTVYVFYLLYPTLFTLTHYLIIGSIIGIASQVGDLIESLFKRDVGVKDSSAILPGHGGFLDRFDAPTFTVPIIYFYISLIVLA